MTHKCDLPECDGTKLGHELAADFPEETKRLDEALDRLARPDDHVKAANLVVEDCEHTGFTGEGRCIEPKELGSRYCAEHNRIESAAALEEIKSALTSPGGKITLPFMFNLSGGPSGYGVQVWVKTAKVGPVIQPKDGQTLGDVLKLVGDLVERSDDD